MQVQGSGVNVDELIEAVKRSVVEAGVSSTDTRDLRVAAVGLTLDVVAERNVGGGLTFRVPVLGTEFRVGRKRGDQQKHKVDIRLATPHVAPGPPRGSVEDVLASAIRTIRDAVAVASAGPEKWVLEKGSVEISFAVTSEGTISGGAEGFTRHELTNTLRLELEPVPQPS